MLLVTGVASTTHRDLHNERFAKSALDSMAKQLQAKYIPYRVMHNQDWNIGVLLAGRVSKLEDGEFGLFIVAGIYENDAEKQSFAIGAQNTVWQNYDSELDEAEEQYHPTPVNEDEIKANLIDPDDVERLLERHIETTDVLPDGRVYKIKKYVASAGELQIILHTNDHDPPHFHVQSKQKGYDASFYIDNLELYRENRGKIPRKDIKKIQHFFSQPVNLKKLLGDYQHVKGEG